jgi:hypothetical protein
MVLKPGCEARLDAALTALRVFAIGASWGGTRSLIAPMSVVGDRTVNPWIDKGTLVRISIGLEDPADLWRFGGIRRRAWPGSDRASRLIKATAFFAFPCGAVHRLLLPISRRRMAVFRSRPLRCPASSDLGGYWFFDSVSWEMPTDLPPFSMPPRRPSISALEVPRAASALDLLP